MWQWRIAHAVFFFFLMTHWLKGKGILIYLKIKKTENSVANNLQLLDQWLDQWLDLWTTGQWTAGTDTGTFDRRGPKCNKFVPEAETKEIFLFNPSDSQNNPFYELVFHFSLRCNVTL